jgi:anthranilate synthase component 1
LRGDSDEWEVRLRKSPPPCAVRFYTAVMMKSMPARTATALPSLKDFARLAKQHSLVPVHRTLTADLETPVSAFLRLAHDAPEAFLLESVEGGERVGRYTFMGIAPYRKMTARGRQITVEEGRTSRTYEGDLFAELKAELRGHTPARLPGLPPFTGGAVGFFAYDVVRLIETLPSLAADELGAPDACLMFFDQVLAFDHVKKEIHLIVTVDLERETRGKKVSSADLYTRSTKRLDKLERLLDGALPKMRRSKAAGTRLELRPRTTKAAFLKAVAQTKEYIAAGDVFQCVLSQRFDCTPGVDAFEIYRALRIVNPSPYMYFLRFGLESPQPADAPSGKTKKQKRGSKPAKTAFAHIVGSSPELLVRVKGRTIEYRPIAGTRRRGDDEAQDKALGEELLHDTKEVAEHVMLVDLGRNDVGRVSEFGSVRVKELMFLERYSHVMHLVSAIEGTLRAELEPLDALRACFPAGTLSGAPKIRAMEIIEEMEPARRGIYGGAILYADFNGNLDSCIAIRTLYMNGTEGHIQAGAGIVVDSVPVNEFEECRNKARAVVRAIEQARG